MHGTGSPPSHSHAGQRHLPTEALWEQAVAVARSWGDNTGPMSSMLPGAQRAPESHSWGLMPGYPCRPTSLPGAGAYGLRGYTYSVALASPTAVPDCPAVYRGEGLLAAGQDGAVQGAPMAPMARCWLAIVRAGLIPLSPPSCVTYRSPTALSSPSGTPGHPPELQTRHPLERLRGSRWTQPLLSMPNRTVALKLCVVVVPGMAPRPPRAGCQFLGPRLCSQPAAKAAGGGSASCGSDC